MTGAQLLISALKRRGVTTLFGIPGYHILSVYDALYQDRDIRCVGACHEGGAAFMADGYARATGRVGVCLTTAGPGVTNASTGLGEAFGDSIPVFLISGDVRSEAVGKEVGAYHEMDLTGFTRPLTKWNGRAESVAQIPRLVARGFEELTSGRPRPVHLAIPVDVLAAEADPAAQEMDWGGEAVREPVPCQQEGLESAFRRMVSATSPLILVGGGATANDCAAEIIRLMEALQAPVLFTQMGKGVVPEDRSPYVGYCRPREAVELISRADCVIALGVRFTDLARQYWQDAPQGLIHVNIDAAEMGNIYPPEVPLVCDVKAFARAILDRLEAHPYTVNAEWVGRCRRLKEASEAEEASRPRGLFDSRDLQEVLSPEAVVTVDSCLPAYAMYSEFKAFRPRSFLGPTLFYSMGYSLPAAIGAKVAFPERQVVSVCGDGGFLMTGLELAAAKKQGVGVVAIVINDRSYGTLKRMQRTQFGGRHVGVELPGADFVALAASFGVPGFRVREAGQFKGVLEKAFQVAGPALVEVVEKAP